MTLFALEGRDEVLAVRFACSPAWETLNAVRTLVHRRSLAFHEPWHELVRPGLARLDLAPLLATQPQRGFVPDFLAPPPRVPWPRLRDQLAEARRTPPTQVAYELERCRETVRGEPERALLTAMLADPARARDRLAAQMQQAWSELVAPFWVRIRALLAADIAERSRALAEHGLRRVVDELHPNVAWTDRGVTVSDRDDAMVSTAERGLVLMPSAYLWPNVAAILERLWQPTIAYPARGVAELWHTPPRTPEALARLLGRTRALVLASLERPYSTTALAELLELSPAGTSRHLLALRDAGLIAPARHGHEVRYRRTRLGAALVDAAA
ncbi:MAG TPA: DUF5937 family protein [Solirubrobacteraceae bacterium]|nr:DUF5937 family protein [Solirubrobacteraceae bacterium]